MELYETLNKVHQCTASNTKTYKIVEHEDDNQAISFKHEDDNQAILFSYEDDNQAILFTFLLL